AYETISAMRLLSFSTIASLLLASGLAACGGGGKDHENPPMPCATDEDCVNANPCQVGTCGTSGVCTFTPGPDGPIADEVEGDCRRTRCENGGQRYIPDDLDIGDDNDPCTEDSCANG